MDGLNTAPVRFKLRILTSHEGSSGEGFSESGDDVDAVVVVDDWDTGGKASGLQIAACWLVHLLDDGALFKLLLDMVAHEVL